MLPELNLPIDDTDFWSYTDDIHHQVIEPDAVGGFDRATVAKDIESIERSLRNVELSLEKVPTD